MSICTFIASDKPLREVAPTEVYSFHIDVDTGTVDDGGADDNFFLHTFEDVQSYTDKKYGVWLEWNYTESRAKQVLNYIKENLQKVDSLEMWHVWLGDYYEYEESPVVKHKKIALEDLTIEKIKEIDEEEIWNKPDRNYPERPTYYCTIIERQ